MSTHFRPRPPSVPSSPVRPSTAHSTIRAVTPSPPHDLPRPKSAHAINSPDMTTFAHYVLKDDDSKMFNNTPPTDRPGSGMLRRSGARTSRSVSPVKARRSGSVSPIKERRRSPIKAKARSMETPQESKKRKDEAVIQEEEKAPNDGNSFSSEDVACPDTPTPMTREQKRSAYLPLGQPIPLSLPAPTFPPPQVHTHHYPSSHPTTTTTTNPSSPISPTRPPPPIPRKSSTRAVNGYHDRISISGTSHLTALSAASKNSIFSTPGRDELERKKALVEVDDGPFGQVGSIADLREERRKVSGGSVEGDRSRGDGANGRIKGKAFFSKKDDWNGSRREVKIKEKKRGGCLGGEGKCAVM